MTTRSLPRPFARTRYHSVEGWRANSLTIESHGRSQRPQHGTGKITWSGTQVT